MSTVVFSLLAVVVLVVTAFAVAIPTHCDWSLASTNLHCGCTYNKTASSAFAAKTCLNCPAEPGLDWNPYATMNNSIHWPSGVCAFHYPDAKDRSKYYLRNFTTRAAAEAAGAFVTHNHPCGYCSSAQDLAVYMDTPDLTNPGRECGLISILSKEAGRKCFQKIGFSPPCAASWFEDAQNTRKHCFDVCIKAWIEHLPNNNPPNSTVMGNCILCDEIRSGPLFKYFAGRTRRTSGIVSAINRPPAWVYHVVQDFY